MADKDSYCTVAGPASAEYIEQRSRFLAEIRPVTGEEEAAAFLAEKRAEHREASHHCSAYLLRGGLLQRYSDDGEPQGTAGLPILEVLRREALEDCMIVVTRYFGGTLLGAGGLLRAYSHSAKLAVQAAERVEILRCVDFSLPLPYPLYDRAALLLADCGAVTLDSDFAAEVTLRARIAAADYDALAARLTELSGGGVRPIETEECFAALPRD